MRLYYEDPTTQLFQADALEFLETVEDKSVDLIATDPPYFRAIEEDWDRQWKRRHEFLEWIDQLARHWRRVLKVSGSLYCFASAWNAREVENTLAEHFDLFPRITWVRQAGRFQRARREDLRCYFPQTEAIVFAEQKGQDSTARGETSYNAKLDEARAFVFEPIREYLDNARKRAGYTPTEVNRALGNHMAGHYFTRSQWTLPTRENYERLRQLFATPNPRAAKNNARDASDATAAGLELETFEELCTEYEELREDYETLRAQYLELRRPFELQPHAPHTDVWTFDGLPANNGAPRHPTQKPVPLMAHMIQTSTKEGGLVLDCFAGSGTTLRAAKNLGRRSVGCELEEEFCRMAAGRLAQEVLL